MRLSIFPQNSVATKKRKNKNFDTHDNVVITSVALAAIRTLPVLVPYVRAIGHVTALQPLALPLGGASLGDVKLLLRTLGPIRRTCAPIPPHDRIIIRISQRAL